MVDAVQGHEAVGGATTRGKPDPNVKIPPAVKAAADRAEALSKQAKEAREANPQGQENVNVAVPPSVPNTGVVTASFDPKNPNPPTDVPASQPPPQAPVAPSPQTVEDWEHQFKSLKGRYDRETENNRRLSNQLNQTQQLLSQVNVAPSPQQGSGVKFGGPIAVGRYVTPKDVTDFGEELFDAVGRRAQEVYEPVFQQMTAELQQLKRQVGGVQNSVTYDAQVKMYNDLAKEVPNWDAINNSPDFARWLDQPDAYSGVVRRQLLNIAHNSNLSDRVIAMFKGFTADQAAFSPDIRQISQPGNGADYPQGNSATTPRVDLAQYAAPGRAKPGQTSVPPEKPIFNAADIPSFYRDKIAGKYAGREAEADAIERALFDAQREGRIRR